MKNNCVKGLFKIQKNGVFLFSISLFVSQILTFCVMKIRVNGKILIKEYLWKY